MTNMAVTVEQHPSSPDSRPNAQTRLAIERTLLAWIRTGLSLLGFGFVLDRFGFFLRELSQVSHVGLRQAHISWWSGILLIALGASVNFSAAALNYPVLVRARRGEKDLPGTWKLGLALAVLTALGGAAIAVLLFVTGPAEGAGMRITPPSEYRERSHTMRSDIPLSDPSTPAPAEHAAAGLVDVPSRHNAAQTLERLDALLKQEEIRLFARIDHAAGAAEAGLSLRPTTVLLFGNPQVGTPLMQSRQTAGIDLPLKALVWEDEAGQAWLTYNDPRYLAERHGVRDHTEMVQAMTATLQALARAVTGP
jgi:uncharacterized protein (DUF302 family)/uncharacterized membrane protein YidH (DUF202 family)